MNKKVYILGLLLMCGIVGYSQQRGTYVDDTVRILRLTDSTLCTKIDSFIEFEKKCDYYTPDLIIGIHIQTWEDGYFITVGSDDGLGIISNDSLIYGGFLHKGHYVEVSINPDVATSLKEQFFKKTEKEKAVKRYKAFNGYDSKEGIVVLETIEDDSFSYWRYFYQKGIFKIRDRHTFCE